MSAKSKRGEYEPSWTEVISGALLSAMIGATFGVVYLVTRPVINVRELPGSEEILPGAVYFVEGTNDSAKTRLAVAKRRAFLLLSSVSVDENELNSLAATVVVPGAPVMPRPAAKGAKAPPPSAPTVKLTDRPVASLGGIGLTPGGPNFRIRDGEVQIGMPVRIDAFGFGMDVVMQTRGRFAKAGDVFVFEAESTTIGACPLDRIPGAKNWVARRVLAMVPVPDEIATAWGSLADVAVVGSTLRLTMP